MEKVKNSATDGSNMNPPLTIPWPNTLEHHPWIPGILDQHASVLALEKSLICQLEYEHIPDAESFSHNLQ